MSDVSVTTHIAAAPDAVWALVSDVTRMGEWSPETTSCRWLRGATGPAVGAKFRGSNARGPLRWSTTCTVTSAEPGRSFRFEVHFGPLAISTWSYEFSPRDGGCDVTEEWTDRRPLWMKVGSIPVMAVADRAKHNRHGMEMTLASLKQKAEAGPDIPATIAGLRRGERHGSTRHQQLDSQRQPPA